MFGYVRYDLPYLFIKDHKLYKAMYCGLCKGIGEACGQAARMGLTYDMTFVSALLHNIAGIDVEIRPQHCVEHVLAKHPMALVDDMTRQLGALNTVLVYYKLTDDILDGDKGRGKRAWFKKGFQRAQKTYPRMVETVDRYMRQQAQTEAQKVASCDVAADSTACMMRDLSCDILGEKSTEHTQELFYYLGKWIYLIDALDDYDKDVKKGAYNPFVLTYGCESRQALMQAYGAEIAFIFDTVCFGLREHLSHIQFAFNRDLTDNIILRGIPVETHRVMRGEPRQVSDKKLSKQLRKKDLS